MTIPTDPSGNLPRPRSSDNTIAQGVGIDLALDPRYDEAIRDTLSNIGDAVITTDARGQVISMNRVAESLTGWPEDAAVGMPLDRVFTIRSEQGREPIENPVMAALREGRVVGLSNRAVLVARDGAERAIDDSCRPDQGRRRQNSGNRPRVSGRHRIGGRTEDAAIHLTAIVASSDDAIVSKDLNGVIRTWNEGAQRIFGYLAAEVVGKPITILLPPDRLHEETEILRRLRRGERVEHFDTIRLHKTGRLIDISVSISPIRDSTGRVVGASKIARDISARKRIEQIARFMADASAALAAVTDYESTLQRIASFAVPTFADWCAVDMTESDGSVRRLVVMHTDPTKVQLAHDLHQRYPPHSSDNFGLMKVLRSGEPDWAAQIAESTLAGAIRDAEQLRLVRELGLRSYICVPLCSRTMTIGALTFATAESGRTYTTDDLRAAEDLAHWAVISIENARLVSTLKESDRRKDEFLAMLAHELRNPLAPIRNAVEIMRGQEPSLPEMRWARDVIDRQVEQMTRLIDDLLDVSRITRGKIELFARSGCSFQPSSQPRWRGVGPSSKSAATS